MDKLLVINQGKRAVNWKDQVVISFWCDDFGPYVVYFVKWWARIETKGNPGHFFDKNPLSEVESGTWPREEEQVEIEGNVFQAGNCAEYIALVRNQWLIVDDDNEPAPENVPTQRVV